MKLAKKRAIVFSLLFFFSGSFALYCQGDESFLLFGFSLNSLPYSFSNSWLISQGGDYPIAGELKGGYEAGLAYKSFDDRAEYHLKTFLNTRYDVIRLKQMNFYIGAGAGLLQLMKVTRLQSSFNLFIGYQGIVGAKIGRAGKDKLCLEIQLFKSGAEGHGLQVNFLAGVRF